MKKRELFSPRFFYLKCNAAGKGYASLCLRRALLFFWLITRRTVCWRAGAAFATFAFLLSILWSFAARLITCWAIPTFTNFRTAMFFWLALTLWLFAVLLSAWRMSLNLWLRTAFWFVRTVILWASAMLTLDHSAQLLDLPG